MHYRFLSSRVYKDVWRPLPFVYNAQTTIAQHHPDIWRLQSVSTPLQATLASAGVMELKQTPLRRQRAAAAADSVSTGVTRRDSSFGNVASINSSSLVCGNSSLLQSRDNSGGSSGRGLLHVVHFVDDKPWKLQRPIPADKAAASVSTRIQQKQCGSQQCGRRSAAMQPPTGTVEGGGGACGSSAAANDAPSHHTAACYAPPRVSRKSETSVGDNPTESDEERGMSVNNYNSETSGGITMRDCCCDVADLLRLWWQVFDSGGGGGTSRVMTADSELRPSS